jgi:hypothetical protein
LNRLVSNVALFGVSCAIGLVALELGVRWFIPRFDPSGSLEFHMTDDHVPLGTPDFVGRQYKNTGDYDVEVAFNRYGLRDRRDLASSRPGDLFVAGDSFSMGWGVEERERYSNVLDELVGERVYNLSIPTDILGYARLVAYAERHGAPVKRLIVGVCMENDLTDYDALGDVPVRAGEARGIRWFKGWLTSNSGLYLAVTTVVHQHPVLREAAVRSGLIVDNIAGMPRNQFSEAVLTTSVERLRRLAEPYDTTVLVIPSRGLWVGGNAETETRVHDRFVSLLHEAGLDAVDMRPILEATGDPMQFHFPNDPHWNAKGHAKAAEALRAHLAASSASSS